MNFLEYSNIAASHVRNALKEPLRSQASAHPHPAFPLCADLATYINGTI